MMADKTVHAENQDFFTPVLSLNLLNLILRLLCLFKPCVRKLARPGADLLVNTSDIFAKQSERKMTTPIKKKLIANSVNTPSTSAPRIKRRTTSKTNSAAEPADNNKPANDSHCNGATENPVTRSNASRISA